LGGWRSKKQGVARRGAILFLNFASWLAYKVGSNPLLAELLRNNFVFILRMP